MAIIYFDGGSSMKRKGKTIAIAWGIVAHLNGETHEVYGSVTKSRQVSTGCHELLALFESVLFAVNRGLSPTDCSFYTDDLMIAHAGFYLHPGNRTIRTSNLIMKHLTYISQEFYPDNPVLLDVVVDFLIKSRFSKVKGHSGIIDNCRADYLVRQTRHNGQLVPYQRWLESMCNTAFFTEFGSSIDAAEVGVVFS
jgi:ribonuclease HI